MCVPGSADINDLTCGCVCIIYACMQLSGDKGREQRDGGQEEEEEEEEEEKR